MRGPSGLAVCLISLALNVGLWQRRPGSWTNIIMHNNLLMLFSVIFYRSKERPETPDSCFGEGLNFTWV